MSKTILFDESLFKVSSGKTRKRNPSSSGGEIRVREKKVKPETLKRKQFFKYLREKQEEKYKNATKEVNEFLNSKPKNMKVKQLISKIRVLRGKKWELKRKIIKMKTYIGLSNPVINIIIPKKVEV